VLEPQTTTYGPHKNDTLVYRGSSNLRDALADAMARAGAVGRVDDVLVTGGSAGGMSTILHVDRIKRLMGATDAEGVPEAGFFLETNQSCTDDHVSTMWCELPFPISPSPTSTLSASQHSLAFLRQCFLVLQQCCRSHYVTALPFYHLSTLEHFCKRTCDLYF
jgi:hypothetical protein